jgi:hypothetical protein
MPVALANRIDLLTATTEDLQLFDLGYDDAELASNDKTQEAA